jgi:hypothetical protein
VIDNIVYKQYIVSERHFIDRIIDQCIPSLDHQSQFSC